MKAKITSQFAKSHVEEAVVKPSGDDRLEADDEVDQVAGHVKRAGENLKDAIKTEGTVR